MSNTHNGVTVKASINFHEGMIKRRMINRQVKKQGSKKQTDVSANCWVFFYFLFFELSYHASTHIQPIFNPVSVASFMIRNHLSWMMQGIPEQKPVKNQECV